MAIKSTWFAILTIILKTNFEQFIQAQDCELWKTNEKGMCHDLSLNHTCSTYALSYHQFTFCKNKINKFCCPLIEEFRESGKRARAMCNFYHTSFDIKAAAFCHEATVRGNQCGYGGVPAKPKEFPHMALLGYGNENFTTWGCGGSLISMDFVLTAAHCLYSADLGNVTIVRLGELDYKNSSNEKKKTNDFDVLETIPHPNYKRSSHYHDIGLIRIKNVGSLYKPICLHTYHNIPYKSGFTAAGWGETSYGSRDNTKLLKLELNLIPYNECQKRYAPTRRLVNGINDVNQFCAGHHDGNDPCPGDSGGPFQVKVEQFSPENEIWEEHFKVIGIISFGKGCGGEDSAGVYTRVAPYTQWIEDIVWPIS